MPLRRRVLPTTQWAMSRTPRGRLQGAIEVQRIEVTGDHGRRVHRLRSGPGQRAEGNLNELLPIGTFPSFWNFSRHLCGASTCP